MIFKAYKYRIYPTQTQRLQIEKTFGCCRLIYNLALQTKIEAYKRGVKLSAFDLCYQLVDLKKEHTWLKEVDSQSLQMAIKNVDKAFKNFYEGASYPKFKKKSNIQSFQAPNTPKRVNFENKTLTIAKIPNIPIVLSRSFEGKIKSVTISKTATGKYFASILVEIPLELPIKPSVVADSTIGIDLGIKDFAIFNNGEKIANPHFLKNDLARLKILQRRASKKKKGSQNKKKANLKVAKLHEKIANKRSDFLHNLSCKITNDNQVSTVCMEDLKVANMVKNHKLAKSISDVSWSEFVRQMKYKCDWKGKNFIQIGAFEPSSKTCSNCGVKKEELNLSERIFNCESCNFSLDRDQNAAINIKNFGIKTGLRKLEASAERRAIVRARKQKKIMNNI